MKFLHPEFLFGLFAIAIPVIVHLFNFRKAKKVYFSNTRFIQQVKKTTSAKRRLKHLLILASRILFIIFLVLAFAQPLIPAAEDVSGIEDVYIYVDNSQSMSNRIDDNTRGIDEALSTVSKITEIYPPNTNYKILTNDFAPFSNTLKNKDEINELVTEIGLSNTNRSFAEYYDRLLQQLPSDQSTRKDVYMISDFQKSTFGRTQNFDIDSTNNVFLVPVNFPEYGNVMVDTLFLSNPFVMESEKNELNVVLRNTGTETAEDIGLKLFINDIQAATSTVSIEPQAMKELSFGMTMPLQSTNKIRLSIEEFPVTFDNEFYLVANKSERISVLEIKDTTAVTPVEVVYGNEELFELTTQHVDNLDYSLLSKNDLVVINSLADIDNTLKEVLSDYRSNGGYILVIPDETPAINTFQSIIKTPLRGDQQDEQVSAVMPQEGDPFFENIFESVEENFEMPSAKPVWQWSEDKFELLKLRNNRKLLSELEGNTYLFSVPLESDFTNFHRHALFVPIMYRIAVRSKDSSNPLYYSIINPVISYSIENPDRRSVYKLISGDQELIPSQRIIGNELIMESPQYMLSPGFYDLVLNDSTLSSLAFNLGKDESILETYNEEELQEIFSFNKNVTIFEQLTGSNVISEIKKQKFGVPLWKYALILALIFLLVEILLIRLLK